MGWQWKTTSAQSYSPIVAAATIHLRVWLDMAVPARLGASPTRFTILCFSPDFSQYCTASAGPCQNQWYETPHSPVSWRN